MKAIRFHQYGGPDVLRLDDADRPEPGPGQVLVAVAATSYNPVDSAIRAGYLREQLPLTLPAVPGIDLAGTVAALGEGVTGFAVGDRVTGFLWGVDGGAAEYAVAPATALGPAPASIPLTDAAALPTVGLTAWQALFEHAGLTAGAHVLVNGAGGAVGRIVVQLAKQAGAVVTATAGPRSADAVRAAGADRIVDHTAGPLADAVTGPADVVVTLVPGADTAALTALTRDGGVVVSTTGPVEEDPARKVRGVALYVHPDTAQLAELAARIDAGTLRVDVEGRYPLAELADVHRRGEAGQIRGKAVVVVAGE